MSTIETIVTAGRSRRTVRLTLLDGSNQATILEVEPYSHKTIGDKKHFFCLDRRTFSYINIPTADIKQAEITARPFKPRFPVNL